MRRFNSVRLLIAVLMVAWSAGCTCRPAAGPPEAALEPAAFQQIIETLSAPRMQGRDAGSEGLDIARDYLVDHFESLCLEPAFVIDGEPSYTQPLELRVGRDADDQPILATVENVGALLPGVGDLADQVVVVGGHYDHVGFGDIGSRARDQRGELHPGADDNASGTAAVMLLAQYFAASTQDATTPRRTILFTGFAGEERGLHGSRYMTTHPEQWAFDADQVSGMINFDMVGRLREGELFVFTDETGRQWRDWINQANEISDADLNLQWDVRAPGGSDHSLFIQAGIPAVFFNTWLHADYHTPDDTPDKINAEGGAQVIAMAAHLLDRAATDPDRLVFVEPGPRVPPPFLGIRYEPADHGVRITRVNDDGPMGAAGAQEGDVITAIGGQTIHTPIDLRLFLLRSSVSDEVVVELVRGEETVELTLELAERD